jgi:hypothetical protein
MFAMLQLPISLAVLAVPSTADILERAQQLCREAEITRERAALSVADCRQRRLERRRWKAIWSAVRARRDQMVACCAYCARFRTPSGEWAAIPAQISKLLHQSPSANLTHGICPDCLARHEPNLVGSNAPPSQKARTWGNSL